MDVARDVEAVVVDPHRVPDTEGHLHDPLAEPRDQVEAGADELAHVVEAEAALVVEERCRVEHRDRTDLHGRLAPLEVQEARVEGGKAVVLGRHRDRVRPCIRPPRSRRAWYGAVMSLSASCVWHVQADLVNALDAQLGPPVDSYVNGTQTWLTEDGPGGVALEWRLHPVAEYRPPTGLSHYDLWEQVVGAAVVRAPIRARSRSARASATSGRCGRGSSASPPTATRSSRRRWPPRPPTPLGRRRMRPGSSTTTASVHAWEQAVGKVSIVAMLFEELRRRP